MRPTLTATLAKHVIALLLFRHRGEGLPKQLTGAVVLCLIPGLFAFTVKFLLDVQPLLAESDLLLFAPLVYAGYLAVQIGGNAAFLLTVCAIGMALNGRLPTDSRVLIPSVCGGLLLLGVGSCCGLAVEALEGPSLLVAIPNWWAGLAFVHLLRSLYD